MSNITQNELLQSAKGLLIKYEFSDHALYDNGIDLGIEVPKELRTRWEKEYYEYLVETFDWLDEKCIYRIRKILEYGLADNDFSVLDKFYEILKNYTNIHIEKNIV